MAPQLIETDINGLLEEVLTLYEDELAQRRIRIERNLSSSLPRLMIDTQQIKQGVINILKNALEAMENGGMLFIRTYAVSDTEAAVEIGDTGPGISAKAMHNIFNPYYTTKPRGTGLGLPITNRIIQSHKGKIEVRNRDGGGAIFTIKLPLPESKDTKA
jgi:signal transduction histidine kinase